MKILDFVNPFSNKYHACQDFKKLSAGYQALTVITVAIASIFTAGLAATPLFRALVNVFTKLDKQGNKPHERTARTIDESSRRIFNKDEERRDERIIKSEKPSSGSNNKETRTDKEETTLPKGKQHYDLGEINIIDDKELKPLGSVEIIAVDPMASSQKKVVPFERAAPKTMSEWKKFMRAELASQLYPMGMAFKEAEESGDCFFDSVAYLLTLYKGDKQYTAKDVRLAISKKANEVNEQNPDDNKYKTMLKGNVDGITWESFCKDIHKCANEYKSGEGAPIWGDKVAAQLVADIYGIEIHTHTMSMIQLTSLMDVLEGGMYEKFNYLCVQPAMPEICTIIDSSTIKPENGKPNFAIDVVCIDRGPWGHFMPVVKIH